MTVGHLRTGIGNHEVDLLAVRDEGRVVAVECKRAAAVVRHLRSLAGVVGPDLVDAVELRSGPVAYQRPDGIAVVPSALLGP